MKIKEYKILRINKDNKLLGNSKHWKDIPDLTIENYLWMNNNYKPKVTSKLCFNDSYLFLYFKSFEDEISASYTKINDPVHKDSCVEFFVNLFPNQTDKYFNFEVNPLGTFHVGFGAVGSRISLSVKDIQKIKINFTITKPIIGNYSHDYWEVFYKIPLSLFEQYYSIKFNADDAIGNFYKCGDESKYEHYGVWNHVESPTPNFHLSKYFGLLIFDK